MVRMIRAAQLTWCCLWAATILPFAAQAAWADGAGKPIADTESMRSVEGFGVQIVLTEREGQFRQSMEHAPNLTGLEHDNHSTSWNVGLGGAHIFRLRAKCHWRL
jgi:hypothetical protein